MAQENKEKAFDLVGEWNSFVKALIVARDHWDKCSEFLRSRQVSVESFPIAMQRYASLSLTSGKFDVGATQLIEFSRRNGGLEVLEIPIKEKGAK